MGTGRFAIFSWMHSWISSAFCLASTTYSRIASEKAQAGSEAGVLLIWTDNFAICLTMDGTSLYALKDALAAACNTIYETF